MESTGSEFRAKSHYQPLPVVLAAFCAGIAVDRAMSCSMLPWSLVGCGCLFGWLVLHCLSRERVKAVLLVLAIGAIGGAWHHCRWSLFAPDDLGTFAMDQPTPVCVEAIALKGPRRVAPPAFDPMRIVPTGERTRLLVRAAAVRDGSAWLPASGIATLTVDGQLLGVHAGDRIRVFGTLCKPRRDQNPGGFDQVSYLRGSRQLCRLWTSHPDCVTVVEAAPFRGIRWWIERLRTDARRTLWQNLPPDHAELASAVLLGARAEIDPEQTSVFVETGTVHLLAISGLHVGIVAGALLLVLRMLPLSRTSVFWIVVGWTIAYTLLTDARPPAIRATILVAVLAFARLKRRPASPWNSLAAAGLIVLALNPADLFSTGVHLSFLAVATLMIVSPRWFLAARSEDPLDRLIEQSRGPWERLLRWLPIKFVRLAIPCGAVWLVTLPLVASRFHVAALGAVLLNVVLWIPMAGALVTGFLMILSGWLAPPMVPFFAYFCNGSLWALQGMIEAAHRLPGNPIWVTGWPDWWLVGFYGVLGALVYLTRRRLPHRRKAWGLLTIWIVLGAVIGHRFAPQDRLVCTIVSVGHGSAVILELPGGPVLLYDAGRMASPNAGARDIAGSLWARKICRLDGIVIPHADADHFNAIPELLRRFSVDKIFTAPGTLDGDRGSIRALRRSIDEHGVPLGQIVAGDRIRVGAAVVEALHPSEGSIGGHDNAASIVLSVEFAGRRIILPGDVDEAGLDAVLRTEPRPCDVLLAPHHGSLKTNAPGLAAWCSPKWVVVSGDHEPRIEPVAQEYRATGADVLYTGDVGAVTVTLDAGEVRVETHLGVR